jgi:predicted metal-dependent phosphoesterase TrpH
MRARIEPLLCELHAHTTWSDGALEVSELVDVYGRAGFDVLCVTDHVVRADDPWLANDAAGPRHVTRENHAAYLAEIEAETNRARLQYGLLVLPGLELTYNELDPLLAAHAVAVGCRHFASVDGSIDDAMARARENGAAIIAAHPYGVSRGPRASRTTQRFARDRHSLRGLVDRYELFNREDLYAWVARARLPVVATGDFHVPEHLPGWKTLVPCAKDEEAIVEYLRSPRPVYLTRLAARESALAA